MFSNLFKLFSVKGKGKKGTKREKSKTEERGQVSPEDKKTGETPIYLNSTKISQMEKEVEKLRCLDFGMSETDFSADWFFPHVTRRDAEELLEGQEEGTFLVRPSSQRGSYAMSFVGSEERTGEEGSDSPVLRVAEDVETNGGEDKKEVRHQLIYGLSPGYSLIKTPKEEEKYESLTQLVLASSFLIKPLKHPNIQAIILKNQSKTM